VPILLAGAAAGCVATLLWLGVGSDSQAFQHSAIDEPPTEPAALVGTALPPAEPAGGISPEEVRAIRDAAEAKVYAAEQQRQRAEEELRSLATIHQESLDMLRQTQAERDEVQAELDSLKTDLELQAAAGNSSFLRRWQFLGPLTDAQGLEARNRVERDPFRADLQVEGVRGAVTWKPVDSPEDRIGLSKLCEHHQQGVCYLMCWVYVPADRKVTLSLGSDDGFALWVNQTRVIEKRGLRSASPDQDRVKVPLVAGWNQFLANIDNSGGSDWAFLCEIRDENGATPLRLPSSPQPPRPRRANHDERSATSRK
jgi:hypothetical protein